jgi:hypothetical protein
MVTRILFEFKAEMSARGRESIEASPPTTEPLPSEQKDSSVSRVLYRMTHRKWLIATSDGWLELDFIYCLCKDVLRLSRFKNLRYWFSGSMERA